MLGMEMYAICDYGDWIAIADHEGKLMKYNPTTRVLDEVHAPNVHYKLLRALLYDGKDLFVGTQDGLFIINEAIGKEEHIMENTLHPYGLVSNLIYSLYQDRNRGLWLGTIYNGVDYMPRNGMLSITISISQRQIRLALAIFMRCSMIVWGVYGLHQNKETSISMTLGLVSSEKCRLLVIREVIIAWLCCKMATRYGLVYSKMV